MWGMWLRQRAIASVLQKGLPGHAHLLLGSTCLAALLNNTTLPCARWGGGARAPSLARMKIWRRSGSQM